jgi:hypothetical protein
MRLPSTTIVRPEAAPIRVMAPGASQATSAGVQPSIDIGCILSTAAGCFFKCGLDVPCLLACAPGLVKCL